MRGEAGLVGIDGFGQDYGPASREAMKLAQQSLGFLVTTKQPEIVPEHHDRIERVGGKAMDLFDGEKSRIPHAPLPAEPNRQWRAIDRGHLHALTLKIE